MKEARGREATVERDGGGRTAGEGEGAHARRGMGAARVHDSGTGGRRWWREERGRAAMRAHGGGAERRRWWREEQGREAAVEGGGGGGRRRWRPARGREAAG